MTIPLTFSQYIENDYNLFKEILLEKSNFDCDSSSLLKIVHSNVYKYKELFSIISLDTSSKTYHLECLNGQIEFFWLISIGKYKLASMALRGAMENFSQALMYQFFNITSMKFSENMDRSMKAIIDTYCLNKPYSTQKIKSIGKDFRSLLLDPIKNTYWDLSDIVHSRNQLFNSCKEFLEEVIQPKHNNDQLDDLLNEAIKASEYILILFYFSNFPKISVEINDIKLDIISSNFPSVFEKIKEYL